jgi:hypothetical protein
VHEIGCSHAWELKADEQQNDTRASACQGTRVMPMHEGNAKACMRHARKKVGAHSLLSMHSMQPTEHSQRNPNELGAGTQIRGEREMGKNFLRKEAVLQIKLLRPYSARPVLKQV